MAAVHLALYLAVYGLCHFIRERQRPTVLATTTESGRQTPPAMATDSNDELRPTTVPQRSTTPPPSAAGDFRPTPSTPIVIVHSGRLLMSEPSGHQVLPTSFVERYPNVIVASPFTPPEYYAPRVAKRRLPANRIALEAAAALEATRDRQPLLMTDAYTVPLQDGTVNPMQYCMIGLLFAGLCAAAALVVVYAPIAKRTTPFRSEEDLLHPERRSRMLSPDPPQLANGSGVVVITDWQNAPVDLGVDVFGSFAKPGNSVDTKVTADFDFAPLALEAGTMGAEGRVSPGRCDQYYYTYCVNPTANVFHYDPNAMECFPNSRRDTQL
ncbi:hypothetical protein HPB51_028779 [Rhipicephalus microplus]|uniref:Uncharacterized protein n=1 Tax=Rhipicephalus microplus TaxID=6941 RepID=A0A9J6CWP0_RHIMP|nr:hypothetical protein HPB51_028779 [Rhipicephalus microplus]